MTTTTKKPRAARRRKSTTKKTMTSQSYPVIITEQRRKLTELTLFELGLLPFLYLELLAKKAYNRISLKASS